jgi:hypothetical protein
MVNSGQLPIRAAQTAGWVPEPLSPVGELNALRCVSRHCTDHGGQLETSLKSTTPLTFRILPGRTQNLYVISVQEVPGSNHGQEQDIRRVLAAFATSFSCETGSRLSD